MRSIRTAGWVPALLVAFVAVAVPPAGAVTVTAGSASGVLAGQTVDIGISAGDLTGLGVRSYQFTLGFSSAFLGVTDVIEAGTLSGNAGWGDATFNAGTGTVTVSHAGTTPLTGAGTLVTLRFLVNPAALTGGSTSLVWQGFLFNEGSPPATTTNGLVTIASTPQVTVSPNTGEVLVGETLPFLLTGGVTNPVTWGTTDGAVASISPAGVLTGLSAGSVRVFAVDAASRRDTTDGDVVVRSARIAVGTGSAYLGQAGSVPVTVTDLTGLGVRAGQITVSYNASLVTPTGVGTAGTLLDGYGTVDFGTTPGTLVVDFAGTSDLSGAGVLCTLDFAAFPSASGTSSLVLAGALLNESPAIRVNGSFVVSVPPAIAVTPDNVTLLAGQTRQFTLTGTPTPPVAWSTLDPAVATIDPNGLLTALAGGVTKVQATDNVGATDLNTAVTVYDFRAWPDTIDAAPGALVTVPLRLDRDVDGAGIYSTQYTVSYSPTWITGIGTVATGLMNAWGTPVVNPLAGQLIVVGAGTAPLGAGRTLHAVQFSVSPSAPVGTTVPLTLGTFKCNEGSPSAQVAAGLVRIVQNVDVPAPAADGLWLSRVWPNPVSDRARFSLSLPGPGEEHVRLAVYSIGGRRMRTLMDGPASSGLHQVEWNLADESGRRVAPGVYFAALEYGGRRLMRKFATVR